MNVDSSQQQYPGCDTYTAFRLSQGRMVTEVHNTNPCVDNLHSRFSRDVGVDDFLKILTLVWKLESDLHLTITTITSGTKQYLGM